MTPSRRGLPQLRSVLWAAGWLTAFFLALALASCNTYEAITTAPPHFWLTLEGILVAVWQDIAALVDLIL